MTDISTLPYQPISRGGHTLDTLSQEILAETFLSMPRFGEETAATLVRAQTKIPGVHAGVLARVLLVFLVNQGCLRRQGDTFEPA